ncbi:MAG: hydrogenase maturation protease [Anaerolineae bacterium]|nr:hydrogenase maturation protease [Anaerolineae bacterium]
MSEAKQSPPPLAAPVLVVGLGNPLRGDDGVGVRAAALLAGEDLPPGVEVVDGGTHGLGLVPLLQGRRRAVFIDAACAGRQPGEVTRLALDQVHLGGEEMRLSIHEAGLRDVLLLARALGILPPEVVILAVEPARVEWDAGLSPAVESALPALLSAARRELA